MKFDEITILNLAGGGFDFLVDEPNLYTSDDLIFSYQDHPKTQKIASSSN